MKKLLVFLLILTMFQVQIYAAEQVGKPLTIDEVVQQALTHRPDLKALQCVVQANKSNARREFAGYYPKVELGSTIEKAKDQKSLESRTSLNADQLIFSFAGPLQRYQQAQDMVAMSELDKAVQHNLIRFETEKAFLQAWLKQEQQQAMAALKKAAVATFNQQKHKHELAQLDKSVWLKDAEVYSSQLVSVEEYGDDLFVAYKKLAFFMGESCSVNNLSWRYKTKHHLQSLETYYQHALSLRPEILRGAKKMAFEGWNVKLAQGQQLPEFRFNAQAGCVVTSGGAAAVFVPTAIPEIVAQETPSGSQYGFWSLSISFKWPLFDGLISRYQEQAAQANRVRAMLERDGKILEVKREVHEAYFTLSNILKQRRTQKIAYVRQDHEFKVMQQKVELGRIAQADFDQAAVAWQQAQLTWLDHNVAVALAERNLMYLCGYPEK